jgi:hypothetical protein
VCRAIRDDARGGSRPEERWARRAQDPKSAGPRSAGPKSAGPKSAGPKSAKGGGRRAQRMWRGW